MTLLEEIRNCKICEAHLPLGANPIVQVSANSKIVIIGQAPGLKVHESSKPWDDKSGERLRSWLGVDEAAFYDADKIALIPMGFCYPGKGKSGDLPPRKECAHEWHPSLWNMIGDIELTILIGQYAQQYYLGDRLKPTLTETVRAFEEYLPKHLVLPHPSPRNNIWMKKNPWFETDLLPALKMIVKETI